MTQSHGEPENNDDTDAQTLMNEARESDGERIIELFDSEDGTAIMAYAYVDCIDAWAYTSGGSGHVCDDMIVRSAIDNLTDGADMRIVDKEESLFAWGDIE